METKSVEKKGFLDEILSKIKLPPEQEEIFINLKKITKELNEVEKEWITSDNPEIEEKYSSLRKKYWEEYKKIDELRKLS